MACMGNVDYFLLNYIDRRRRSTIPPRFSAFLHEKPQIMWIVSRDMALASERSITTLYIVLFTTYHFVWFRERLHLQYEGGRHREGRIRGRRVVPWLIKIRNNLMLSRVTRGAYELWITWILDTGILEGGQMTIDIYMNSCFLNLILILFQSMKHI